MSHFYLFLCLIFFVVACDSYYKPIIDENDQKIPSTCTAWENKCNIYCRTGPRTYKVIPKQNKCTGINTNISTCIDKLSSKLDICDNKQN